MSWFTRRRNSKPSPMNLTKPLLKCLVTNFHEIIRKICNYMSRDIAIVSGIFLNKFLLQLNIYKKRCQSTNNKYNFAIAEMNAWMTDFWSKEDATETMVSNIKQHKFKVFIDVALLNAAWAIGYYHGAGVSNCVY